MKHFEQVATVEFPEAAGRNVNMMPFILGDASSIPDGLRAYLPLIDACGIEADEYGEVCYLTVMESHVPAGASQRRGGAHVERHPTYGWGGGGWGRGRHADRRYGGLYVASNIPDSTAIWDTRVEEPGRGGSCEHLDLGEPETLDANKLVWLTDATPHASLPLPECDRQFFRVVTSAVDLWYEEHSTPNPMVSLPEHMYVVQGDYAAA